MGAKSLSDDDPRYKEAFRMCYGKMPSILPMKHFIFYLVEIGQLPCGLKSRIQSKETNEEQVQCLLDDIEGGVEAGYPKRFNALIAAVKEFAVKKNIHELKQLFDDIQKLLNTPKPLIDPHESSQRLVVING